MPDHRTSTWQPIAVGTITGNGAVTGRLVSAYQEMSLYFKVTSAGTTLDFTIQDSPDNVTYHTLGTLAQIAASGNYAYRLATAIGEYVRISYAAVGTWGLQVDGILKT